MHKGRRRLCRAFEKAIHFPDLVTGTKGKKRKANPNPNTTAKKAKSDAKLKGTKRKAGEEPAGGWTAFFDTSRAGRPAGRRGSLLLPEGGPSGPQPGGAAAISRLWMQLIQTGLSSSRAS
jgi:hypothetical protein